MSKRTSTTIAPSAPSVDPAPQLSASSASLLTDKQVMQRLGVSRTGLHYLMRQKGLPYIKLGEKKRAALRFSPASLDQWLKQHEHKGLAL